MSGTAADDETLPTGVQPVAMAVSVTDPQLISAARLPGLMAGLAAPEEAGPARRLHFGNEFCEWLLPSPRILDKVLAAVGDSRLHMSLATPMIAEDSVPRLRALLSRLPAKTEVVANDWGVVRLLGDEFPELEPVAGRQLCKMIKDPRLPSADWKALAPSGLNSGRFLKLLGRLGITRIEIDVPPLVDASDFDTAGATLSVHAPFGFAAKARACKIGSLDQPSPDKFRPDRRCRKECLRFVANVDRGPAATPVEPHTFERGNTLFYRHTPAMTTALWAAARQGKIDRIIVAGDWHQSDRHEGGGCEGPGHKGALT